MPQKTTEQKGIDILYMSMTLLCQTFFFGIFSVLMPLAIYGVRKRGGRTARGRPNWLLYCTLFEYSLSAAYWAASTAGVVQRIQDYFIHPPEVAKPRFEWMDFANAVILLNYVITDGILVSRAIKLCGERRKLLYIPKVSLALTAIAVTSTICCRISIAIVTRDGQPLRNGALTWAINVSQVAGLVLTLVTNVTATTLIGMLAWRYRKNVAHVLSDASDAGTKVETVLALLVDSGLLCCVIGVTSVVSAFIRLPHGTLGDIVQPSAGQLAGIYPTIVLAIVAMQTNLRVGQTTLHTENTLPLDFVRSKGPAASGATRSFVP